MKGDRDLRVVGFVIFNYDVDVVLILLSNLDKWKFKYYCVLLGEEFFELYDYF